MHPSLTAELAHARRVESRRAAERHRTRRRATAAASVSRAAGHDRTRGGWRHRVGFWLLDAGIRILAGPGRARA